jgi:hypothetical protein
VTQKPPQFHQFFIVDATKSERNPPTAGNFVAVSDVFKQLSI